MNRWIWTLLYGARELAAGFLFGTMWNWFVATKFGLPRLSLMEALGILLVIEFPLTRQRVSNAMNAYKEKYVIDDSEPNKPIKMAGDTFTNITYVVTLLIIYPLLLGTAYLWHLALQ